MIINKLLMTMSWALFGVYAGAFAAESTGQPAWASMRVMALDDYPSELHMLRFGKGSQAHGVLLNRRRSEVMLLRFLTKAERPELGAPRRPNDPPMVPEVSSDRSLTTGLPHSIISTAIPGIGQRAVVLTGPTPRLSILRDDGTGPLIEERVVQLLPGNLLRDVPLCLLDDGEQVLVAFSEGIQRISLRPDQRAQWLSPRERLAIRDWWLVDADGDGSKDVVDWGRQSAGEMSIRWRSVHADGQLGLQQSADSLGDMRADALMLMANPSGPAHAVALPKYGAEELRVYALERGEEGALGRRQQVNLPNRGLWTGMRLGNDASLIVADSTEPRLLVWTLGEGGFAYRDSWPGVSQVRSMVASTDRLFILRENAGDLLVSYWQEGRLTFPQPWDSAEGIPDRSVLALGRVGAEVWWVRRLAGDLELHRWHDSAQSPVLLRYPGLGAKAQKVQWLGGSSLLVQDKFSPKTRLLKMDAEGAVVESSPPHLAKVDLSQFRLFAMSNGDLAPARLSDGVLQWLDGEGRAIDQVMLDEGESLADLLMIDDQSALALTVGGERAQRLQRDAGGILRPVEAIELPGGRALLQDPILGLILEREQSLLRLQDGAPWTMTLSQVIDYEQPQHQGDAGIHRMKQVDVNGDGVDDLLVFDDAQHRISVYDPTQAFAMIASWQVFSDNIYPYGYRDNEIRPEPRLVSAGDFTGDGKQDLMIVSHDRLLIYFATELGELP